MLTQFKFLLLKVIDYSGLTFLSPVVRLCYGEEPRKQMSEIGQFIVVPVLVFASFLALWTWIAPKHKTKSGEVPTPSIVMQASGSIWTFHLRESHKDSIFNYDEQQLKQELLGVETRLSAIETEQTALNAKQAQLESANMQLVDRQVTKIKQVEGTLKQTYAEINTKNQEAITAYTNSLKPDDLTGKQQLLKHLKDQTAILESQQEKLAALNAQLTEARSYRSPELRQITFAVNELAEEKSYLMSLQQIISSNNRVLKQAELKTKLQSAKAAYVACTDPSEMLKISKQMLQLEKLILNSEQTEYAKPWTLPDQIVRSVFCVFCGFLLGTMIAIPVGILCGLSPLVMASMTPFIALFKPVSPIVWLPIAVIIVGGFIPDPDKHWLILGLEELPLIGWMKINPGFIASAITVALCSLWATLVNTALGVSSIDKDHLNVARVLRLGTYSKLTKIVIPSALPLIFAGLRISLGVGWMVLIAAELLASSEGIGKFIWDQFNNGASDSFAKMFVVVFLVGFIGLLLDRIMIILQRLVSYDRAVSF